MVRKVRPPHPITGGAGPTVLTYDIRAPISAGEEWKFFQSADRDFQFSQADFKTHVLWVDFSTFSNHAASGTETVKLELIFEDALGSGVKLGNNWNTRSNPTFNGTRSNQVKPRRAVLATDGSGEIEIDPLTQLPVVRDVLDGNLPNQHHVRANLNYVNLPSPLLFSNGVEEDDDNPNDADGDQKILNTLFHQQAVIRLEDYQRFNFEVEWKTENPDISGDANWRSLKSVGGLGAGTTLTDPGNQDTLAVTEPLRNITNISLQAARRDIDGAETGILPSIVRSSANINTNQTSTNGVPDEQATANQQMGLGHFKVQVYHRGDLNRDGQVTLEDLTASPLLANFGLSEVEDNSIAIGSPTREVSWVDGDAVNSGRITVADALAGVLTGLPGTAPTGPELAYNGTTGNLQILANGATLSGFSLVTSGTNQFVLGNYANPNPNPASALQTVENFELSWLNLTTAGVPAGGNLSGTINLGNVLPSGLSDTEFETFFSEAVFNVGGALSKANSFFASPTTPGDFDGNNAIDGADFLLWQREFGGSLDAAAFASWEAGFGTAAASFAAQGVPEPTTGILALAMSGLLLGSARRRNR
jgi:hypothetical protein